MTIRGRVNRAENACKGAGSGATRAVAEKHADAEKQASGKGVAVRSRRALELRLPPARGGAAESFRARTGLTGLARGPAHSGRREQGGRRTGRRQERRTKPHLAGDIVYVGAGVAGEAVAALPLLHDQPVPAARAEEQHRAAGICRGLPAAPAALPAGTAAGVPRVRVPPPSRGGQRGALEEPEAEAAAGRGAPDAEEDEEEALPHSEAVDVFQEGLAMVVQDPLLCDLPIQVRAGRRQGRPGGADQGPRPRGPGKAPGAAQGGFGEALASGARFKGAWSVRELLMQHL